MAFDANGGQVATESKEVNEGEPYGELPEATREGHTFLGWYTAVTDGEKVTSESICEGDITLYAHWEKMSYDVIFDANGGSSEDTSLYSQEVEYMGCAVEPADPAKEGFVFEGWYTEGDEKFDFTTPITGDLNLIAKWTRQIEELDRLPVPTANLESNTEVALGTPLQLLSVDNEAKIYYTLDV